MNVLTIDTKQSIGIGSAYGHHGEIIQGVIFDRNKKLHRVLVTLPWKTVKSKAKFIRNNEPVINLMTLNKNKALRAAEITGTYITGKLIGGVLNLYSDVPIGRGVGSSTIDVVSTIKAVANSLGTELSNYEIAKIAVEAELASDSIMFNDQVVLFGQREGIVFKQLGKKLPKMYVLGIDAEKASVVDTLQLTLPNYSMEEIETFESLIDLLEHAIKTEDVSIIGRVATKSSCINQRYLPKPYFNEMLDIANSTGSSGVQIAHSGTVIGLIFDPKCPYFKLKLQEAKILIKKIGLKAYKVEI